MRNHDRIGSIQYLIRSALKATTNGLSSYGSNKSCCLRTGSLQNNRFERTRINKSRYGIFTDIFLNAERKRVFDLKIYTYMHNIMYL